MDNNEIVFSVPSNFRDQLRDIEGCFTEAMNKSNNKGLKIVRYKSIGLNGYPVEDLLLYLTSAAFLWFTKKWIDEYLWPIIKGRIDKPSEDIRIWLDDLVTRIEKYLNQK